MARLVTHPDHGRSAVYASFIPGNQRYSLQLVVVEFDTCLVWEFPYCHLLPKLLPL